MVDGRTQAQFRKKIIIIAITNLIQKLIKEGEK
jgi:hypothetical protein